MMKEQIRELLNATPFVPFAIAMASGVKYRVSHPDFVLAGSGVPQVVVEEPSGLVHILNVMLITALEREPMPSSGTV